MPSTKGGLINFSGQQRSAVCLLVLVLVDLFDPVDLIVRTV